MTQTLESLQRVVVFRDCLASDATLGYHGTIVRIRTSSIRRYPSQPQHWVYSVYVPSRDECFDVQADEMLVVHDGKSHNLPECIVMDGKGHFCDVRFHGQPADDNLMIHGAYRIRGCDWRLFTFRKSEEKFPCFLIKRPIAPYSHGVSRLSYQVPQRDHLDRAYVTRAIADLIGARWKK